MATVKQSDVGDDIPESTCSECDASWFIYWNRNPVYDAPQFCPFCGDEIESIEHELNDGDGNGESYR